MRSMIAVELFSIAHPFVWATLASLVISGFFLAGLLLGSVTGLFPPP